MCKIEDILCKGANQKIVKLRAMNDAMEIILQDSRLRIAELEHKWAITPQGPPPYIPFIIKDAGWVWTELVRAKNSYMGDGAIINPLLDSSYKILTPEAFLKMAKWLWVDQMEYISEFFDCDDFADVFIGMAIKYYEVRVTRVYDWSGGHAYNMPMLTTGARIWEPQQSGGFVSWENRGSMYELTDSEIQI